jgi:hypothetical protein
LDIPVESSNQTKAAIKTLIDFAVTNSTMNPALMKDKIKQMKKNLYGEEENK